MEYNQDSHRKSSLGGRESTSSTGELSDWSQRFSVEMSKGGQAVVVLMFLQYKGT